MLGQSVPPSRATRTNKEGGDFPTHKLPMFSIREVTVNGGKTIGEN